MILKGRTDCFSNVSDQIGYQDSAHDPLLGKKFRFYYGGLLFPFALAANIVTPVFIYIVYKAIKTRRVSRKCYILLLNRAVSDLMASLVAMGVCLYVMMEQNVNRDVILLLESVFIGSFWTATVSYVALSVLKLLAVWKPLHHRKWLTTKRCIQIIICSWLFYVFMVSVAAGATEIVILPATWSKYFRLMFRTRHFLAIVAYFSTLIVFSITVILIKRSRSDSHKISSGSKKQESIKSSGSFLKRLPLWKISLHILNFAFLQIFYVIWCFYRLKTADRCFLVANFMDLIHVLAFIKYTLVLRITVDSLISFITDSQLRGCLLRELGCNRWREGSSSNVDRPNVSVQMSSSNSAQTVCT